MKHLGSHANPPTDVNACDNDFMLILLWNAGDLDRKVKGDALVNAIGGPWSIILLQEASSTILPRLLEERGFSFTRCGRDGSETLVAAGASGMKEIVNLYPHHDGCIHIPRPWVGEDCKLPSAGHFTAARVRWMQPKSAASAGSSAATASGVTELPQFAVSSRGLLQCARAQTKDSIAYNLAPAVRAGRTEWRAASIHYHHTIAHKPDVVRHTLGEFFGLMIRDRIDMVGGDFNQAHHLLPEILDFHCNGAVGAPKYRIIKARSPEIQLVLFFYESASFYDAEARSGMAEKTLEDWGLKPKDASTHYPLVVFLSDHVIQHQPRSSLHKRSESSIQERKKLKKQRQRDRKKSRLATPGDANDVDASEHHPTEEEST